MAREGQAQEAFEAGRRNVFPGQSWLAALGRGLERELSGADMGSPAGQRLREELGSLGYEQALREAHPEDFAQGRAEGSDFIDPLALLAMRARMPGTPGLRLNPSAGRPMLPGGNVLEGEVLPPRQGLPAPPMRSMQGPAPRPMLEGPLYDFSRPQAPFSGPVSGFEQNAVRAMQRSRPVPGQAGFAYKPEHSATYWEEGGQGFRPGDGDFVPVEVRRNPQEFYDPRAIDQMSEIMRQGNRGALRHPIFGPNADRPNYGQVLPTDRVPFAEMPRPGVKPRVQGQPDRAPYGEVLPGDGVPFVEMPRPGIRQGGGAGVPVGGLRYEPVGPSGNLPVMAQGRGMMPQGGMRGAGPIEGEGYEVQGIAGPGRSAAGGGGGWDGSMDFGVTGGGGMGGRGMPFARAGMMAARGAIVAMGDRDRPEEARRARGMEGPPMPFGRLASMDSPTFASPLFGGFAEHPLQYQPDSPQQAETQKSGRSRAKATLPPVTVGGRKAKSQAAQTQQGFEPNLNYYVTKALDNMFGTNEAERGRQYQQDIEEYQRKYGPIYY